MELLTEVVPSGWRIRVRGDMTISFAASGRTQLLAALNSHDGGQTEIDLSAVSECDTAGLQLLLQLQRRCGNQLRLVEPSTAVLQVLRLSGTAALFGNRTSVPSRAPRADEGPTT